MKTILKTMVRGAYDVQKLRIQMGNRVVANFRGKLGIQPSTKEEESENPDAKKVLDVLRKNYVKITDGITKFPRRTSFKGNEVISNYTELCLLKQYVDLEDAEEMHFKLLKNSLKDYPIYTDFLESVKGVGPAMAAVIISEIDIEKAKYASSLHKLAGLDVVLPQGEGRSKKKEHLVEVTYIDREGEEKTKMSITFKPFLKTKLCGVLGPSFLRAGDNKYSQIYNNYKNRLENSPAHTEKSKGHRHNMSIRYMVKMFLIDLYAEWRAIEGLEVYPPYHEAKLGLHHKESA